MKNITKTYTKEDLVVKWKPGKCIHSAVCFHGLPGVFDPRRRPWIDLDAAAKEEIAAQIKRCPSGALSLQMDEKV